MRIIKRNIPVNRNLSVRGCWRMVNAVNSLEKVKVAQQWLDNNDVISIDEYDALMRSLSYISRELHRAG